jgi:ribonuclease HIII
MADCFVTQIDPSLSEKLRNDLTAQGFEIIKPPHTIFCAKRAGIVISLYESGKLTVQGKNKSEFISYYLEPEILKDFSYNYPESKVDFSPRAGVDEAGKGDFFGPLSVASLYADEAGIKQLMSLGVKDSKSISDKSIIKMAREIEKNFAFAYVTISPVKYNELYAKFRNVNSLLAWAHATAIEGIVLKTGCKNVRIDQFAAKSYVENSVAKKKLDIDLHQKHHGEDDIVVAGASILARYGFLMGLERLKERYKLEFPKGASNKVIEFGRSFVERFGKDELTNVCKLHFKTTEAVISKTQTTE